MIEPEHETHILDDQLRIWAKKQERIASALEVALQEKETLQAGLHKAHEKIAEHEKALARAEAISARQLDSERSEAQRAIARLKTEAAKTLERVGQESQLTQERLVDSERRKADGAARVAARRAEEALAGWAKERSARAAELFEARSTLEAFLRVFNEREDAAAAWLKAFKENEKDPNRRPGTPIPGWFTKEEREAHEALSRVTQDRINQQLDLLEASRVRDEAA
jgi:excinuclease UvrABC ATPase subunit